MKTLPEGDTWTTRRLLGWMQDHFQSRQVHAPEVTSQMLLSHVLGVESIMLYTDPDRPASNGERARLRDLVARAARQEPVQHLVGEGFFLGRSFEVTASVLIPRTASEVILQVVMDRHRGGIAGGDVPTFRHALDLGTGTGCLAVSLALQVPRMKVIATDVSSESLEVAKRNIDRHGVSEQVELREGSWFEPIKGDSPDGGFDLIASNPPYIADATWDSLDRNVREFEPSLALRGGPDGLDCIRSILDEVEPFLAPSGMLVLEFGDDHAEEVRGLGEKIGPARIQRDAFGDDRVLVIDRAAS